MEDNKTLKQLYREQLLLYPMLTQEEIVELYNSEGIVDESLDDILEEINVSIYQKRGELTKLQDERNIYRRSFRYGLYENKIFGIFLNHDIEYQIKKLKDVVISLKQQVNNLQLLIKQTTEIFPDSTDNIKNLEAALNLLNQDILTKEAEICNLRKKEAEYVSNYFGRIEELKEEIKELEDRIKLLGRNYKNFAHQFITTTRGRKVKNRKYPSLELRNKIVCGTLGFARYWANVYYRKEENTIPLDDLIQIAYQALMSAAYYYVPSDRAKFTSYARVCIENKLKKEVYSKKKMKKRPSKPESFFQTEKDNIKYIQSFLYALKTKSRSGLTRYYSLEKTERISVILHRFREDIRAHNRDMLNRSRLDRLLPSFSSNISVSKIDTVVNNVINMINNSKMQALVTSDDRKLANQYVNYLNITEDNQEINELIYYLDCYLYKLELIETYLEVEEYLTIQNEGATPADEEILEEINKRIRHDNKEKTKLKKEGFYGYRSFRQDIVYNTKHDYWHEYKAVYSVDPFITPQEYEKDGISSKQKERDDIIEECFGYSEDEITTMTNRMISTITHTDKNNKIILYRQNDLIYDSYDIIPPDKVDKLEDEITKEILSIEEALAKLKEQRDILPNIIDSVVKSELESRKKYINNILSEKNASLIEEDKEKAKLIDKYAEGPKHKKYFTEKHISEAKESIELLYEDDSELLLLLNQTGDKNRWYHPGITSVEEEALSNVFLEDYYKALKELPELEREVLLRYYNEEGVHDVTAKTIGKELGITENQVYKVKTRALKKLSQHPVIKTYKES